MVATRRVGGGMVEVAELVRVTAESEGWVGSALVRGGLWGARGNHSPPPINLKSSAAA